MDLTDFLLARIAEDEAYCRVKISLEGEPSSRAPDGGDLDGFLQRLIDMCGEHPDAELMAAQVKSGVRSPTDPTRILAQCDALRRIVEHERGSAGDAGPTSPAADTPVLRLLALPYAEHPDFREEWRA